jgi:hypothetical protein
MSFIYETSREVMFSLQSDGNVKVVWSAQIYPASHSR